MKNIEKKDKHKGENNIFQTALKILIILLIIIIQVALFLFLYKGISSLSLYATTAFLIIKISAVIYIIYRPINPSYKISWIFLITLLPVFGTLMFILFGNTGIRKKLNKSIFKNKQDSDPYLKLRKEDYLILKQMDINKYKQACFITNVCDMPLYRSNSIDYLDTGEVYLEKLLNDLKKAEKYIFLEYFIISKGYMWDKIYSTLKSKAKKGVKIYILTDQIGSNTRLPEIFAKDFKKENIYTKFFNPISPFFSLHINYRDHRKLAVIDGKIAYTGGINIGDEYINKTSTLGYWKDFGVRISGKSVTSFTVMFLNMWNIGRKEDYLDYDEFIDEEPAYPNDDNGFVLPFNDGPNNSNNPAENTYINMINSAKKSIYITTPYLILDNEMINSLVNASYSGIDVRIVMPHIPDKKLVFLLSRSYYDKLLKAGIKIYEFKNGFVHGKSCVIDGDTSFIGTSNFDFRSFYLHYECGIWSYNTGIERNLQDDIQNIIENSYQVRYDKWKKRNILIKIIEAILKIISPML